MYVGARAGIGKRKEPTLIVAGQSLSNRYSTLTQKSNEVVALAKADRWQDSCRVELGGQDSPDTFASAASTNVSRRSSQLKNIKSPDVVCLCSDDEDEVEEIEMGKEPNVRNSVKRTTSCYILFSQRL